jgi:hypothetical protein
LLKNASAALLPTAAIPKKHQKGNPDGPAPEGHVRIKADVAPGVTTRSKAKKARANHENRVEPVPNQDLARPVDERDRARRKANIEVLKEYQKIIGRGNVPKHYKHKRWTIIPYPSHRNTEGKASYGHPRKGRSSETRLGCEKSSF